MGMDMQCKYLSVLCAFLLTSCSSLDAGWRAQKAGDYDEAQKQAMIALSREPRNPEVYQLVAATALARGQYDTALKSAEFARKLDGGSKKSERLVREASYAKKDWKTLCEAGIRASKDGYEDADTQRFQDGYAALKNSKTGDGYGCVVALESAGVSVENADKIKHAYASQLVSNGRYREALEIATNGVSEPAASGLVAARSLFALNRKDEAAERLQAYVNAGDGGLREMRFSQAAEVCEMYRQYPAEAKILENARAPENTLRRVIALRRSYRQDEAEQALSARLENKGTATQTLADMKALCDAGYGDMALRAYAACSDCGDSETVFKAAEMLMDAHESEAAMQMMADLGDANASDGAYQVRLFNWYRQRKYSGQALLCADRAAQAGVNDDDFVAARLETFIQARDYKAFERESRAWTTSAKDTVHARTVVAGLEANRSNWGGVLEVLRPLEPEISGEALSLYLKALSATRDFEGLDQALSKYQPNIKPQARAEYFRDIEAKPQFLRSLEPMVNGSESDRFEREMMIGRFAIEIEEDAAESDKHIENALSIRAKAADYARVVQFYRMSGRSEKALEYSELWQQKYPSDEKACQTRGEIYLASGDTENAGEVYAQCVSISPDKYSAIKKAYQDFGRYNEGYTGLRWVERVTENKTESIYRKARAESYYDQYLSERDMTLRAQYRDLAVADFMALGHDNSISADDAMDYASALAEMEADAEAFRAFEAIGSNTKLSKGARMRYARAAAKSGQSDKAIRAIVTNAPAEEVFDIAEMLESWQRADALDPELESYLGDESSEKRIRAYHVLVSHASANGDIKKIESYNKKLESSAPDNPDIRMEIAKTAINHQLGDEAVRHLTYLQMVRPDSRDVLNGELTLVRVLPEHDGARALLETSLDAAEGVYHRLNWISQYFEQHGDYARALYYAEKAHEAATMNDNTFNTRLLKLYLRTGKYEESETAPQLVAQLRDSIDWKPQAIVELAEVAQDSGYYNLAQVWMNEAISLSPDLPGLKVKKLEMAIDSNDEGQISLGLARATEAPVADVTDPLVAHNQMRDVIDTIDLYEQSGERALAISTLLRILPEYVQTRGVVHTRRILEDLSAFAPEYRAEAVRVLASESLMGDSPCQALAYSAEIDDPEVWAKLAVRCPDAHDSIVRSVRDLRSSMTSYRRYHFDNALYRSILQMSDASTAQTFADELSIAGDGLSQFERNLTAGSALDAMQSLTQNSVEAAQHIEVVRLLSSYGYLQEAVDYARDNLQQMPENDRQHASAIAILLGAKDDAFTRELPGNADSSLAQLDSDTANRIYAADSLKSWMHATNSSHIAPVFHVALACALHNPSQRKQIFNDILAEIDNRPAKNTLLLSASDNAIDLGLYDFAQSALGHVNMISSDYVYRSLSVAQAHLGDTNGAWQSLETGARNAANLGIYWKQAAEQHSDSALSIRQHINTARRAISPRQPELWVNETALALEAGNSKQAAENAERAFQYGGNGILPQIAKVYANANAPASIPDKLYAGSSSASLEIQAAIALNAGNADEAMQHYIDAAQRAPWPITSYSAAADTTFRLQKWPQTEQLIAKMAADYPHAYTPFVYRAMYDLAQNTPDEAFKNYQNARQLAFATSPWIEKIVYAAAKYDQIPFAQKLYAAERATGSLDSSLWLDAILSCSLDDISHSDAATQKSAAQKGIAFIEKVLPAAASIARNNETLRHRFIKLADKADRQDWLQRLGTTSI